MAFRKKNRDINIFSMSALDLFASAMGAFILIMLIVLPYYMKTDSQLMAMARELKQKMAQMEKEKQQLQESLDQAEAEKKAVEEKLEESVKMALLGISTKVESFTLVVDLSGSMKDANAEKSMRHTVEQLIEPMSAKNKVMLIGYQGSQLANDQEYMHYWPKSGAALSMDNSGKVAIRNGIVQFVNLFDGGTPTWTALKIALESPTEAVILISDGKPNNPWQKVIEDITWRNNGKKEIHSVAVGDYNAHPELIEFLSTLAEKNNGDFAAVSI